jgi:hypothetical protein
MNKPSFGMSSDYAFMDFKNGSFYYGYEITSGDDEEWCFEADFNKRKITIPFSKLGASDMFNCADCLLMGIGWILAKYDLIESKQ